MAQSIFQRIVELERKVAEQERRNRNRRRTGVVTEVNTAQGLARVKFSDQPREYKSGWIPWQEFGAGKIKTHFPPAVGEQVDVVSENGDLTDACIVMSTPSDSNPRPHSGPEPVIKYGDIFIRIDDDKLLVKGDVRIEGSLDVVGAGTHVTHNDHRIDETHRHKDTVPGPGLSGVPE